MKREWQIKQISYKSISIGYVTTLPEFRGRGFASLLLRNIEKLAKKLK